MFTKEFRGYNGTLILTDRVVTIKRGLKGALLGGGMLRGDKAIPYSSIIAIQLKKAGLTAGYLQLTLKGGSEPKSGLLQSTTDENSINFHFNKNKDFEEARQLIEEKISNPEGAQYTDSNNFEKSAENNKETITQKKEWYKESWGILVAFLFFPLFLLWYMWEKTNWSKKTKWIVTGAFIFVGIMSAGSDSSKTPAMPSTPTATDTKTTTVQPAPQTPKFTFDVPDLIGKNIDEIKATLGEPSNFKAPTKQQLAIDDEWNMTYEKDKQSLLVTYNVKTKTVKDFFIDGTDKNAVLVVGNVKTDSQNYVIKYVNSIKDPSVITGVIVSKKLPENLNGDVTYNAIAFKVDNKEEYDWADCKFEINGGTFSSGYVYKAKSGIKANDSLVIPFSEFTKDGTRFNFFEKKPENLAVSCSTNGQFRTNYFTIGQ